MWASWGHGSATTFNSRVGVQPVVNVNQWSHYCLTADWQGSVAAYKNGNRRPGGTGGALPLLRERTACRLGMDARGDGGGFQGSMASFKFWDRGLSETEVRQLAQDPPAAVRGARFAVVGVPQVAVSPSTPAPVSFYPSLLTALPVSLVGTVTAGGFTLPAPLTWGGEAGLTQTLAVVLPRLPPGAAEWTLTFALTGPGAGFMTTPGPYTIQVQTPEVTAASAAFTLNTNAPSANAGWAAGSQPGTGYATFSAGARQFLDLNQLVDTRADGGAVMPPFGSSAAAPQGHSFAMWVAQPDLGASFSHTWLACTAGTGDLSDGFILSYAAAPSVCCSYNPYHQSAHRRVDSMPQRAIRVAHGGNPAVSH